MTKELLSRDELHTKIAQQEKDLKLIRKFVDLIDIVLENHKCDIEDIRKEFKENDIE